MPAPVASSTGETAAPAAADTNNTVLMSVLAYLGILVFVPLLLAKENPVVKFHVKQGLVLFIIEAAVWFVGSMMYIGILYPILALVNLGCFVLAIIGIINAVKKQEKELPLVGDFAKHLPM